VIEESELRKRALKVLDDHWDEVRGHTYPNTTVFPHQWLWDSSFAAVCWHQFGEHERARRELAGVLSAQFPDGFVPHVRHAEPNHDRGPLAHCSSYTQPPIYAHAARVLAEAGPLPEGLVGRIGDSLDWLWRRRRAAGGLIYLVHPWEAGTDDSPRWDDWVAAYLNVADPATLTWDRANWTVFDWHLVDESVFDDTGIADHSTVFECAAAGYNALYAHAAAELAALTGEPCWQERSAELGATIDKVLWNEEQGLWSDQPLLGGGPAADIPTLDGVLGALVTANEDRAMRALDQLVDPTRFAAPYGLAFVARDHPAYAPDDYWRGPGWMQMNYLAALAARRWDRDDIVQLIATMSRSAVEHSRFSEHWNPETGEGHGPTPLTWSALVVAISSI
jgi:hypothetical protein